MIKNNKISGITLVEALGVIALGLVLISLALQQFFSARQKTNVFATATDASSIYTNTVDFFNGADTTNLTNQLAEEAGLVPDSMRIDAGNAIKNAFLGDVTFASQNDVNGNPTGFSVEFDKIPDSDVCISVLKSQALTGWDEFSTEIAANQTFANAEVDPTLYNAACQDPDGVIDDVTFYFFN